MIQITQIARTAILKIIEEEGGWVGSNHPVDIDRGTYAGIRYKTFKNYILEREPNSPVLNPAEFLLTAETGVLKDLVMDIYYENYYQRLNIDRFVDSLKMPVLSCGVNCGTRRAGMILQYTINCAITKTGIARDWLKEDGVIGPKTLNILDKLSYAPIHFSHNYVSELEMDTKLQGLVNIDKFRNNFVKNWCQRYVNITVDKPEYIVFLAGWFNRANKYWLY